MARRNIDGKTSYAGQSNKHQPTMAATTHGVYNCTGAKNVQMFLMTADGKVLSCLPGFWFPQYLLEELELAAKLNRIYRSTRTLDERDEKFIDAHLAHVLSHSPRLIGDSRHQRFDANDLLRRKVEDFGRSAGSTTTAIKLPDQVFHERMADRPFLSFDEFNAHDFVDMGRSRYKYDYGIGQGNQPEGSGSRRAPEGR